MRVFLDTSLLSDYRLASLADEIAERNLAGDEFYISVITHFQLIWGYSIAGRSREAYEAFLRRARIEIAPLTKIDAEEAAQFRPTRKDLLDALIAAGVKRHEATIWTTDGDFLKYLPEENVRLL